MNTITCHRCHLDVLVDSTSTVSLHRTSQGTVGYVRCPLGHLTVVHFERPPATVPGVPFDDRTCAAC